jgi:hypothetical protein
VLRRRCSVIAPSLRRRTTTEAMAMTRTSSPCPAICLTTLGKSQYPALLADINRAHVAFSVHDGDLKAGADGPCSDSLYDTALNFFNSLERPLIFVPGNNDWTDC